MSIKPEQVDPLVFLHKKPSIFQMLANHYGFNRSLRSHGHLI